MILLPMILLPMLHHISFYRCISIMINDQPQDLIIRDGHLLTGGYVDN